MPIFYWLNIRLLKPTLIARTVAHHFSKEGQLGASFFFSKGGGDLGNASKFVQTLAIQLSHYKSGIAERIYKAIVAHPDECANQDDAQLILQLFAESKEAGNIKLRIFVTSRPEQPINLGFGSMGGSTHRDIALHSVFQDETERDISAFLKHELGLVSKERGLYPDWPNSKDLEKLVRKANGLFIYAATACRFIRDRNFRPRKQLSLLLKDNPSHNSQTAELDEIYMQVLRHSVLRGEEEEEEDEEEREEEVKITLSPLGSVLDVSNLTEVAPQLLHPSFRDFLLNPE
ncbi:hypothetical protein V2W45_1349321 [Cenococcum geophilum]